MFGCLKTLLDLWICLAYLNPSTSTLVDVILDNNFSVQIETCRGECGLARSVPCSCHAQCFVYWNCCENITVDCPGVMETARDVYGTLIGAPVTCHDNGLLMVSGCPVVGMEAESERSGDASMTVGAVAATGMTKLEKKLAAAPVTDLDHGITFTSRSVYHCFGNFTLNNLSIWQLVLQSDTESNPMSIGNIERHLSTAYFRPIYDINILSSSLCHTHFLIRDYCNGKSEASVQNQRYQELCLTSFTSTVKSLSTRVYRNRYCLACNEGDKVEFAPWTMAPLFETNRLSRLSILVSLSASDTGGYSLAVVESEAGKSWTSAKCNYNLEDHGVARTGLGDITCETVCMPGYDLRPSGNCELLQMFQIAIPDDDMIHLGCPDVLQELHNLFRCQLQTWEKLVDFSSDLPTNITLSYDVRMEKFVLVVQLQFYALRRFPYIYFTERSDLTSLVAVAEQAFLKIWRSIISSHNETVCRSSFTELEKMPILNITTVRDESGFLKKEKHNEKVRGKILVDSASTEICISGSSVVGDTSEADLICVPDAIRLRDEELVDLLLNSTCFKSSENDLGGGVMGTKQTEITTSSAKPLLPNFASIALLVQPVTWK